MENNNEPILINGEPAYETQQEPKHYERMEYYDGKNYSTTYPPRQQKPKEEEYGLISMICGIIGLLFMGMFPFSTVLGIVAVIMANKSTSPEEESYKKVGKITGIISIVLSALLIILFIAIIAIAMSAGTASV